MKTHEEMVDEIYNDTSYRGEFKSYIRLTKTIRERLAVKVSTTPPWSREKFEGLTYDEITAIPSPSAIPPDLVEPKRHAEILYCSLQKALAIKYALDYSQALRLVLDVVGRYEQSE